MDFADPDLVPLFEWGPAGKSAQFARHRLYRRAAVQQRVSVLYGLVPAIACSTPRGGETNVVVPAEAEIERVAEAPRPRVARQPLPVSRPAPRAGIAASNAKPSNTKASNTKKVAAPSSHIKHQEGNSGGHGDSDSGKDRRKVVAAGQEPERKLESSDRVGPPRQRPSPRSPPAESRQARSAAPPLATLEIAAAPSTERQVRGRKLRSRQGRDCAPPETTKPRTAAMPATAMRIAFGAPDNTAAGRRSDRNGRSRNGDHGREAASKSGNPGKAGDAAIPTRLHPDRRQPRTISSRLSSRVPRSTRYPT